MAHAERELRLRRGQIVRKEHGNPEAPKKTGQINRYQPDNRAVPGPPSFRIFCENSLRGLFRWFRGHRIRPRAATFQSASTFSSRTANIISCMFVQAQAW